jgi:hypothetical protein
MLNISKRGGTAVNKKSDTSFNDSGSVRSGSNDRRNSSNSIDKKFGQLIRPKVAGTMSDALYTSIDKKKKNKRVFMSGYRVTEPHENSCLSAMSDTGYDEEYQYGSEEHDLSSGSDYLNKIDDIQF